MDAVRKSPNIVSPVLATILALLGLAICLTAITHDSPARYLIWVAVLFMGSAVLHWVNYLRQYIDFRINKAIQEIVLPSKADENSQGS